MLERALLERALLFVVLPLATLPRRCIEEDIIWYCEDRGRPEPLLRPPVVGRCGKLVLDKCLTWAAGSCVTKGSNNKSVTVGRWVGSRTKQRFKKAWPCGLSDSGKGGTVSTQAMWYMAVTGLEYCDQGGRPVAISITVHPTLHTSARRHPLSVCCSLITSGAIHSGVPLTPL